MTQYPSNLKPQAELIIDSDELNLSLAIPTDIISEFIV